MSADYTDGYHDGYAAAEANGGRAIEIVAKRLERTLDLLRAASDVIKAYGEDEGYTPSRVQEQVKKLDKAGYL